MKGERQAAPSRRAMWAHDSVEVDARHTQSSRDALRRRQKEKRSRIVKRHVMYKQRKRLLDQLEQQEGGSGAAAPIVATELGVPVRDENDDGIDADGRGGGRSPGGKRRGHEHGRGGSAVHGLKSGREKRASGLQLAAERKGAHANHEGATEPSEQPESHPAKDKRHTVAGVGAEKTYDSDDADGAGNADDAGSNGDDNDADDADKVQAEPIAEADNLAIDEDANNQRLEGPDMDGDGAKGGNADRSRPTKQRKFEPFAKERRQYEDWRKQQEAERREHEERIEKRNEMLSASRKKRKQQAQQYRKRTKGGQPKLKHRMEHLLDKLQQQRDENN